jgi:hypothetical protein
MSEKITKFVTGWAERNKLTPEERRGLAVFYGRNADIYGHDPKTGLPDLDAAWNGFRASSYVLRPKLQAELLDQARAQEREEATRQEREQEQRGEEMRRESPRQAVQRAFAETRGDDYRKSEAQPQERVGDTLRRSIEELRQSS